MDPLTGKHEIISGEASPGGNVVGSGPGFVDVEDMAFDGMNLYVLDNLGRRNAILKVNLQTGDRTIVSGFDTSGDEVIGHGVDLRLVSAIAVVPIPEPSSIRLVCLGIAFYVLIGRRHFCVTPEA